MDRKEWLKTLKVGDKVLLSMSMYGKEIKTIDKITPTGRIKIGNRTFNNEGREMGGSTWGKASLVEITDDIRAEYHKKDLVKQLENIRYATLSIDQLERMLAIIKEG